MAYEVGNEAISVPASADLSAKQFLFGTIGATGVAVTGAGLAADGVIANKPSAAAQPCALYATPGMVVKVIDSATGITMPTATTEKLLPSASLTLSINGVDYVTNKNIVSLETGWKNNIRMDSGFFPGSGFQTAGDGSTGAIRGRLEFGNRQGNLRFVARFMNGSDEYTKLKAQTTGTAVVTLAYDTNNSLQLTWQKIAYSVVEIAETDQILTVAVDCVPMYDAAQGILTAVGKCAVDSICS